MAFEGIVLSVLAILVGLFVGLVADGRLRNLTRVHVKWPLLLAVGVLVPAAVDRFDPPFSAGLVAGALVVLLVFALRNIHLVGMSIVALGVASNLVPLVVNGGMPVRADALVQAGLASADELDRVEISGAQRLERPGDRFVVLGDIIPLEETHQVLSFGDLVILVGLADVAANLTRRRTRVAGRLPRNADAALVSIAPPPERTDAAAVIDLRQIERAAATGYAPRPDDAEPIQPVTAHAVSVPSPTAARSRRRAANGGRNIPEFDAITLDDISSSR